MVPVELAAASGWTRELRKGILDLAILVHLGRGSVHGYALISSLKDEGLMASEGGEATVYQALQRLAKQGLATSAWSAPAGDERPRKMYSLTKRGAATRDAMADEWHSIQKAVKRLLEARA